MRAFQQRVAAPAALSASLAGLAVAGLADRRASDGRPRPPPTLLRAETLGEPPRRVAFLGNSYLYFNDCPRVFQFICKQNGHDVTIDTCLRGGSSWGSLLRLGNDMDVKFRSPAALLPDGSYDLGSPTVEAMLAKPGGWDFVIMNTFSQEAADLKTRKNGLKALKTLVPLVEGARARPVLLVTPAYRQHTKNSERLGGWQDFVWLQAEGYRAYAARIFELSPDARAERRPPCFADANRAFEIVRGERPELWQELYYKDGLHPSALGTFLEACVIFCAVFGEAPHVTEGMLEDPASIYARSRRMLPPPDVGRMPTAEELLYVRSVAMRACSSDEFAQVGGGSVQA